MHKNVDIIIGNIRKIINQLIFFNIYENVSMTFNTNLNIQTVKRFHCFFLFNHRIILGP